MKTDSINQMHSLAPSSLQRTAIFFLCSAVFFLSQFYRASNAVIAPQLQRDLSLTSESLGLLSAVFFYAFALMQVPLALFLDRLGARMVMTLLMLLGSVGACVFALSQGLYGGLLGRLLLGIGMAANLMAPLKLFTQWFTPREFATFAGLIVGFGTLGSIAASTPLALLVEMIGWRWAFIFIGMVTAVLSILCRLVVKDGPYAAEKESALSIKDFDLGRRIRFLLGKRDYWLISFGTFFRYGTFVAIQGLWAGPYMMDFLHLSPIATGNIIMLSNIGYIMGCSLGGWLSDRVLSSRKRVVLVGMTGTAAAELALGICCGQSHLGILTSIFFSLGLFGGFGNVMYAHIKGIMPLEMAGMALTGINFFTMIGAGIYIHAMGWILDHLTAGKQSGLEEYQAAFFLAFVGVAAATVCYLFTRESKESF